MSSDYVDAEIEGQATALARRDDAVLPAMSVEQAVGRFRAVVDFVQTVMKPDVDYGVIPGTGKPTLLKPGAEKLCTLFGLSVRLEATREVEDWTGEATAGEPFFFYKYRCRLARGGVVIAEADGSCNTRESKYRWRKSDRICPQCGQPTIINGKAEYGGGYLCFAKKGGCGAKFKKGDAAIEGQALGRVANPDIFDQVNTVSKMAQKRALIAATLIACNASEFFTQDLEDHAAPADGYEPEIPRPKQQSRARAAGASSRHGEPPPEPPREDDIPYGQAFPHGGSEPAVDPGPIPKGDPLKETREKIAAVLVEKGRVSRTDAGYLISDADGKPDVEVYRDNDGRVCCGCTSFKERRSDQSFRCEHIIAVSKWAALQRGI